MSKHTISNYSYCLHSVLSRNMKCYFFRILLLVGNDEDIQTQVDHVVAKG